MPVAGSHHADGVQSDTTAAEIWRRLNSENLLPKVIHGVTFRDGVEVTDAA